MKKKILLIFIVALISACTNYSAEGQNVNPPIIFAVLPEGTGHILKVAAQNVEIGFAGYRIYSASSESAVQNISPGNGTDCGPFARRPNQAVEYIMEAKPGQTAVTADTEDLRLCAFPVLLNSGEWINLRAFIYKGFNELGSSIPSNALQVP